jgi:teichuronic acid exporter
MSLKSKAITALSWSFVQEVSQRGLQVVIGIVLARVVAPRDFGLIAMLGIFIAIAQALLDSGFGSALVQRKEVTDADCSSVFYFNLFVSTLMAIALCFAAPAIANFYHQPQLTQVARAFSIVLLINAFALVQAAMMVRALQFKKQAAVAVTSTVVSGTVGIGMACAGYGVWALVAQQGANSVARVAMLWWLNPWRPSLSFSISSLRQLFGFGSGMMFAVLLNTVFENLYSLVIGRLFSAVTLGFYNRAQNLQNNASQLLGTVANRVTFPIFAQLQDDRVRLKKALAKGLKTLALIQFPLMIGLSALARPIILIVLGHKWQECIPYFQALCLAGVLYPMHLLNLNVLTGLGRSGLVLRLEMIKRALIVVNILATVHWGVIGMVWGQVVHGFFAYYVNAHYCKSLIGYSFWEQLKDLCPYLGAAIVMGALMVWVTVPAGLGVFFELIFKTVVGSLAYLILCTLLRVNETGELFTMVRTRLTGAVSRAN